MDTGTATWVWMENSAHQCNTYLFFFFILLFFLLLLVNDSHSPFSIMPCYPCTRAAVMAQWLTFLSNVPVDTGSNPGGLFLFVFLFFHTSSCFRCIFSMKSVSFSEIITGITIFGFPPFFSAVHASDNTFWWNKLIRFFFFSIFLSSY